MSFNIKIRQNVHNYNEGDVIYGFAHTKPLFIKALKKTFGNDQLFYIADMFNNTVELRNNIYFDEQITVCKIKSNDFLVQYKKPDDFKESKIIMVTKNKNILGFAWKINKNVEGFSLKDSNDANLSFTWPKYINVRKNLSQISVKSNNISHWFKLNSDITPIDLIQYYKKRGIIINIANSTNFFKIFNACNANYLAKKFMNRLKSRCIRQIKQQSTMFAQMCRKYDIFMQQFKVDLLYNDGSMAYIYKEQSIIIKLCKLAILYFLKAGNRVHFILDDLNDLACIRKNLLKSDYITYKELRFIFRYWEYLKPLYQKNKIVFHKKKKKLCKCYSRIYKIQLPPWESKPKVWKKYNPKNKKKISQFFHKNKNKGRSSVDLLIEYKKIY